MIELSLPIDHLPAVAPRAALSIVATSATMPSEDAVVTLVNVAAAVAACLRYLCAIATVSPPPRFMTWACQLEA